MKRTLLYCYIVTLLSVIFVLPVDARSGSLSLTPPYLPHRGEVMASSTSHSQAMGGEVINYVVEFRNAGSSTWTGYQLRGSAVNAEVAVSSSEIFSIADSSWVSSTTIRRGNATAAPGRSLRFEFDARAPVVQGDYTMIFELWDNNQKVDGGKAMFALDVLLNTPSDYQEPIFASRQLVDEPNIRVGLNKPKGKVQFKSQFLYYVYSGAEERGVLSENEQASLEYKNGVYSFKSASMEFESRDYVRLAPVEMSNYFRIVNYERKLRGRRNINFNVYRGAMEYRYSPEHRAVYVINELPLDLYTAGVTETSNDAPVEYIKALQVAARSYAYYKFNYRRQSKRIFHVVATTADQLYLGYNSELSMPRVARATQDTYGQMVTYNGAPIVTPYFSRTNGRTLSWRDGWSSSSVPMPWLMSVEAKYDKGLRKNGHGVGMSMHDASLRAVRDGWGYEQILRYYYSGVEVEKIY